MKNIIFLGGKQIGVACLQHVLEMHNSQKVILQGVLSNTRVANANQESVASLAIKNNIPVFTNLEALPETDILYSVQYHEILKESHIIKAKLALNLHMAPLPEYRGCNQFSFAILDNATIFGTTIHKIDTRIDHGDIAFEKRFAIPEKCWIEDLYKLTYDESVELFVESFENILANKIIFTPQQSLEKERGTQLHFRKEIDEIKKIDLHWDKEKIDRHIRATFMPGFEPPYAIVNNEKKYFTKESVHA